MESNGQQIIPEMQNALAALKQYLVLVQKNYGVTFLYSGLL